MFMFIFDFSFVYQLHLYSRMVRSTLYISLWWLCRRRSGSVCSRRVHRFRQSQSQWGDSELCAFILSFPHAFGCTNKLLIGQFLDSEKINILCHYVMYPHDIHVKTFFFHRTKKQEIFEDLLILIRTFKLQMKCDRVIQVSLKWFIQLYSNSSKVIQ